MSYSATVLADSPVAYWRLGESSGTVAADSSGNGHAGTYHGGYTLGQAGIIGAGGDTSTKFDGGASTNMSTPITLGTACPSGFTCEVWVNPRVSQVQSFFGDNEQYAVTNDACGCDMFDLGGTYWTRSRLGGVDQTISGGSYSGSWDHIVVTYDGSAQKLYVNGSLAASQNVSGALFVSHSPIIIAQRGSYTLWPYDGMIDEVAVYSTALSAARVLAHYNAGAAVPGGGGSFRRIGLNGLPPGLTGGING